MCTRACLAVALFCLGLAGCRHETRSQDHALAQVVETGKTNPEEALKQVEALAKRFPGDGKVLAAAGDIAERADDPIQAAAYYARSVPLRQDRRAAQNQVLRLLALAGATNDALALSKHLALSEPDNLDARAWYALVEDRMGDADKARRDAEDVLAKLPEQAVAKAVLAEQAIRGKDWDVAGELLDSVVAARDPDPILLELSALRDRAQDRLARAAEADRLLVARFPGLSLFVSQLASDLAASGSINEGEQVLRHAAVDQPANARLPLLLYAYLAKYRGQATAEAELKDAIVKQPRNTALPLVLADALARRDRTSEAVEVLRAAADHLDTEHGRDRVEVARARVLVGAGRQDEALALLDTMVAAGSADDAVRLLRSDLLIHKGSLEAAENDLLAVVMRQPKNIEALVALKDVYKQDGKLAEAIDASQRIVHFRPADLAPSLELAELQRLSGHPERAVAAASDFVKNNSRNPDGYAALARAELRSGDAAGASSAIDQLRLLPQSQPLVLQLEAERDAAAKQPVAAAAALKDLLDAWPEAGNIRAAIVQYAAQSSAAGQARDAAAFLGGWATGKAGPTASTADLARANLLDELDDRTAADQAFAAAIEASPKDPQAYVAQAFAAAKRRDFPRAEAALRAGLQAGAPKVDMLTARGMVEEKAGKTADAEKSYDAVLDIDASAVLALNNLTNLVADREPLRRARLLDLRQRLQRAAWTGNADLMDTLAWADYRLGDVARAQATARRIPQDGLLQPAVRSHYDTIMGAAGASAAGAVAARDPSRPREGAAR